MPAPDTHLPAAPALRQRAMTPTLLGVVAGSALQLQQAELWSAVAYMLFMPAAHTRQAQAAIVFK